MVKLSKDKAELLGFCFDLVVTTTVYVNFLSLLYNKYVV